VTVTLRPLAEEDAAQVVAWRRLPEVHRQLFADEPPTLEGHRRWFARYQAGIDRQEFVILAGGVAVGTVGLSHIDPGQRRAEYGIVIGEPAARGRGVARAASQLILARAFGPLALSRVFLHVFLDNTPALNLYRRLGFQREGVLRAHAFKDGAARDVMVMGLLSSEFSPGAVEEAGG
jgi:UDP-4-amino-4,6-dideoxy-N-acetyl-beta-L-altrosamine N-acetyltransferase